MRRPLLTALLLLAVAGVVWLVLHDDGAHENGAHSELPTSATELDSAPAPAIAEPEAIERVEIEPELPENLDAMRQGLPHTNLAWIELHTRKQETSEAAPDVRVRIPFICSDTQGRNLFIFHLESQGWVDLDLSSNGYLGYSHRWENEPITDADGRVVIPVLAGFWFDLELIPQSADGVPTVLNIEPLARGETRVLVHQF